MQDKLLGEFISEFHASWNNHRVKPKPFLPRENFSAIRRVNVIAINGENVTIDEINESGETVRSVVLRSSLSDFRR